jgi:hypothetical protein
MVDEKVVRWFDVDNPYLLYTIYTVVKTFRAAGTNLRDLTVVVAVRCLRFK